MAFATSVLVDLYASGGGSIGNIADRYSGADCVNIDRAGPEICSINRGEYIHFTARVSQIHFQAIVRGETRTGEMQHDELGSGRRRSVGEIDGPSIWTCGRPKIGPDLQ